MAVAPDQVSGSSNILDLGPDLPATLIRRPPPCLAPLSQVGGVSAFRLRHRALKGLIWVDSGQSAYSPKRLLFDISASKQAVRYRRNLDNQFSSVSIGDLRFPLDPILDQSYTGTTRDWTKPEVTSWNL